MSVFDPTLYMGQAKIREVKGVKLFQEVAELGFEPS